jgi:hypothetical protein
MEILIFFFLWSIFMFLDTEPQTRLYQDTDPKRCYARYFCHVETEKNARSRTVMLLWKSGSVKISDQREKLVTQNVGPKKKIARPSYILLSCSLKNFMNQGPNDFLSFGGPFYTSLLACLWSGFYERYVGYLFNLWTVNVFKMFLNFAKLSR